MASSNTFNLAPPSLAERLGYFYGLPGELLFRCGSGNPNWSGPLIDISQDRQYTQPKHIYPIGHAAWTSMWHEYDNNFPNDVSLAMAIYRIVRETGLKLHLPDVRFAVSLISIGYTKATAQQTVLIEHEFPNPRSLEFNGLKAVGLAVKGAMQRATAMIPSDIEVALKSCVFMETLHNSAANFPQPYPWVQPPVVGASIGLHKDELVPQMKIVNGNEVPVMETINGKQVPKMVQAKGSGTLGCYVTLIGGPFNNQRFALTNDHVVPQPYAPLADYTYSRPPWTRVKQLEMGKTETEYLPRQIITAVRWRSPWVRNSPVWLRPVVIKPGYGDDREFVESPSPGDAQAKLKEFRSLMETQEQIVRKYQIMKNRDNADDHAYNNARQSYNHYQQEHLSLKRYLDDNSEGNPRVFAQVTAASGQRVNAEDYCLDWALCYTRNQQARNKISNTPKFRTFDLPDSEVVDINKIAAVEELPRLAKPHDFFVEGRELDDNPNRQPYTKTEIKQKLRTGDLAVMKNGRSTGWTVGTLHKTDVVVSTWTDTEAAYRTCLVTSRTDYGFIRKGDSGSICFDFNGRIVGLIHAGTGGRVNNESVCHEAYVIPWDVIKADIMEKMKCNDIKFSPPPMVASGKENMRQ